MYLLSTSYVYSKFENVVEIQSKYSCKTRKAPLIILNQLWLPLSKPYQWSSAKLGMHQLPG